MVLIDSPFGKPGLFLPIAFLALQGGVKPHQKQSDYIDLLSTQARLDMGVENRQTGGGAAVAVAMAGIRLYRYPG
jgi:hypothetical protein